MRTLLVVAVLSFFLVGLPARTSPKSAAEAPAPFGMPRAGGSGRQSGDGRSPKEQADISRSGRDFMEVCSSVGSEGNGDAARVSRDATCLGWVAGFAEGFLVHDELLGVPRRDRLACVPNGVSAIRIVRVMKKYLADHPEKAHRATRFIASLALAGAFPCRAGK